MTAARDTPAIAIIAHAQAPYRLHVHRRVVHEIPEVTLWSLYTRELGDQPWQLDGAAETRPVVFGQGESMTTHHPWRDMLRDWRKGGRIIRWMKRHNIRAVVVGGYADAARMRVIWWCALRRIPCFITGDANIACDLARGLKGLLKRVVVGAVVRAASGVLPWGRAGVAYFKKYGALDSRIWHFPYEPDYTVIESLTDEDLAAARRQFFLDPARRRVLFVGRLLQLKRVDLLLDAFARIAASRPQWDLVLVGDGPQRRELEDRVPRELRGRVIWCGFVGNAQTLAAITANCHVLVLPGDFEQWGLVVNEAAAAGLALVTSDIVGASFDLVEEGVNGRRHPPGDLDALMDCLLTVTDDANIDRMRSASRQILQKYRHRCDPVAGLRSALHTYGVI